MKNKTKNTAVSGLLTALSVVLMMLTTVIPVFMYVLPIATGLLVLLVAEITDKKWAFGVYLSTSVLALLLLTDKEAALTYALIFGYYPLIKDNLDKKKKPFSVLLKLLIFNCAAVIIGYLGVALLGVSGEEYKEFGKITVPLLLSMANVAFFMYDIMLKKYGFLITHFGKKISRKMK